MFQFDKIENYTQVNRKEFYTFVLNSAATTGTITSLSYNVDWSLLPDAKGYELTFCFLSNKVDLGTATTNPMLYIDFGCATNMFEARNGRTNFVSTTYVGNILPYQYANSMYLYTEENSNLPIFLQNKPTNKNITVFLYNSNNLTTLTPYSNMATSYILTLKIKPVY
jgi:hypothetical protein